MDYVDWVEKVMGGMVAAWDASDDMTRTYSAIDWQNVCDALKLTHTDGTGKTTQAARAVVDALYDLKRIGLVSMQQNRLFKLTQMGKQVSTEGMSTLYPEIVNLYLDDTQLEVLKKLVEICQEDRSDYVALNGKLLTDIAAQLGPDWVDGGRGYRADTVLKQLENIQMAVRGGTIGNGDAKPTYVGAVRVTRTVDTELQALVKELLAAWEGVNVDFKRELNLKKPADKAEFVKDILGLVTTKFTGRRYLVIGFDPKTQQFFQSVDRGITQDRLEDILIAYADPVPIVKYEQVRWQDGILGLIEIKREPHKLPYKIKVNITDKMNAGDVFVRHGSHTVKLRPTDEEYQDLVAEGERAKRI